MKRLYNNSTSNNSLKDIYTILSKYFLQETSEEEKKVISAYKENNPKEFEILQNLWKNGAVEITDFDSSKAWKEVQKRSGRKTGRMISLNLSLRRIAAAVVFVLISSSSLYFITNRISQSHISIVQTGVNERYNKISLSDGSVVWLNRNSTLSYPEKFSGKERNVTLEGEAFFEVTKSRRQRFVVNTLYSEVTVLGTSFNVKASQSQSEVSVKTGKVQVVSQLTGEQVILLPDQKALVTGEQIEQSEINNLNYMAWKTGVFEFKNTPLDQVLESLNTFYRETIVFASESNCNCNLTAKFNQESIEEVVKILETTCDLFIQKEKNQYIIK